MIRGRVVLAGTWSNPGTMEQAAKLVRLFKLPIMADGHLTPRSLYDVMGDDGLYDAIGDAVRPDESPSDVRGIVADTLEKWMYEGLPSQFRHWRDRWEPEAVKLLLPLVKKWATHSDHRVARAARVYEHYYG